ncbi:MAG: hypothetical protein ABIP33_00185 [Pseudolysinimonas sp.]
MTDPRYDEQFRRGYDGPPPAAVPPADRAQDSRSALRIPDPPVVPQPQEPEQGSTRERDPDPLEVADWIPPARDPSRLALLLVGIAMLLGAGLVIWFGVRSSIDQTGEFGPAQQSASTIERLVPPALIIGGLVSFIVWLVLVLSPVERGAAEVRVRLAVLILFAVLFCAVAAGADWQSSVLAAAPQTEWNAVAVAGALAGALTQLITPFAVLALLARQWQVRAPERARRVRPDPRT